uniref:Uncharacterized protein n=1 Tax=Oryza meridionalis TaxID=40149 RepID=A0A0E0CLR6_9ORYZ
MGWRPPPAARCGAARWRRRRAVSGAAAAGCVRREAAASYNVTGITVDTRELARVLHQHGAFACFDFAARRETRDKTPYYLTW